MGLIANIIVEIIRGISGTINLLGNIVPQTKIFGFIDILTLILLIISLLIAFAIKHFGRKNWKTFFIWFIIIFILLKFI